MSEHELRRRPVLVDLVSGAVLGVGRTTAYMLGTRLDAAPPFRVDRALFGETARSAVVRPPGARRVHGGRGA